ncbi:MAG: hypothetical protein Fur0010_15070 [Bdellovibrio sp.]
MNKVQNFEDAIQFLKSTVKYSNIEGQKHIDPALVNSEDLQDYYRAMMLVRLEVQNGALTEEELKQKLGLI